MAEKPKEFFASVFTAEDLGQVQLPKQPLLTKQLRQIEMMIDDVVVLPDRLKINKTPGPDGIHPRVIRELKNQVYLLTIMCNLSLMVVPDDWKAANSHQSFKRVGERTPGNYKLVSLTLVQGKMVESLIYTYKTEKPLIHSLTVSSTPRQNRWI